MKKFRNIVCVLLIFVILFVALSNYTSNSAAASEFGTGDIVEVTNTLALGLKVRDAPAGNVIGNKPNGSRGVVLGGPTSAGLSGTTYIWWKVRYEDGLEGWSAGGYPGGVDYLQKISISPSSKFTIGSSVEVTASSLTVRSASPVLNAIDEVHNGDKGQVIGGPFYGVPQGSSGFYHFWNIDYGGISGWSAENWLSVAVNQPPTCSVSPNPSSGDVPLSVTFTINTNDPDGTITAWVLDIDGDGNADYSGTGNPPSTKSHTYTLPGAYNVIFMVSDDDGVSSNSIATINVGSSQIPPSCSLSANPQSGTSPLTVTFSITANDSDGSLETWVLDVDSNGTADYSGSNSPPPTISHTYSAVGTYTATLMVSDDDDLTAAATQTVSVSASEQPVISCTPMSFSFNAIESGSNPPSQNLSIRNSNEGALNWTVSDGAGWLSVSPTSGTSTGETDTVTVSISISGKAAGMYDAVITVSASGATNTPQNIPVTLAINTNSDIVTFPDSNLEAVIRDKLGKSSGDITRADLEGITILSATNRSISNLSGLEYCTGLRELNLLNNNVTDISPLAGCNQLYLLTLTDNNVTDISVLAGLPALKLVYLARNQISDVSALGGLQHLQRVVLFDNQVSNIAPLVQNTGIGSGEEVDLRTNPLSGASIETYIPQLESRGVNVLYDSTISILLEPAGLAFTAVKEGTDPAAKTINIWRSGAGSDLNWTVTENADWLTVSPTAGTSIGEQDTVTVSVDVSGLSSGEYQAEISVSAVGAANSPQTVPVNLNITEADEPDFVIESITYLPQAPSIGDTVTFTVKIKNQGSDNAANSKVYYFIDGIQKGYDYVSSLEPGETTTETFTWSAQDGQHVIKAIADYQNSISESDENNNEKQITFSSTALSDLVVESITWSPQSPSIGDTVTFSVKLKNQGNGEAGNSKVYYFIDNIQKEYDYVNSLEPGETATETFTWSAQDGQHAIIAIIDYDGNVSESDEGNNEKTITYSATALADLIVSEITWDPVNPSSEDTVTFSVKLKNQGSGEADSSNVYYFIDNTQKEYDYVSSLAPGETATETFTWSAQEGQHVIKAIADHQNSISESDENNNEQSVTLSIGEETVSAPDKPDGNTECNEDTEYSYSTGGAASSYGHDIEYRFDWGDGNYSDWSSSVIESYSWSEEGSYIVKAQARCAIHTSILSDWSPGLAVYVEVSPEISAEIADYDATPRELETGDNVQLYLDIRNTGNVPWQFYAAVSLRKPNGEDVHLPMKAVSLNQGETGRSTWNYTIDQEGEWDVVFGIWKEKEQVTPLEHTGWLKGLIEGVEKKKSQPSKNPLSNVRVTSHGEFVDTQWGIGVYHVLRWDYDDINMQGFLIEQRFVPDPRIISSTKSISWPYPIGFQEVTRVGAATRIYKIPTPVPAINTIHFKQYRIAVILEDGSYSDWSDIVELSPQSIQKLEASLANDSTSVELTWNYASNKNNTLVIHRWEGLGTGPWLELPNQEWPELATLESNESHYSDKTIKSGYTYMYYIDAINSSGQAIPSSVVKLYVSDPDSSDAIDYEGQSMDMLYVKIYSPVELRIIDSIGRVTGLVNGIVFEEIPNSIYYKNDESIAILNPVDSYYYEIVGIEEGSYDLMVTSIAEETKSFSLLEVSTSVKAVHEYTLNWDVISEGGEGITMKIDSEGDGDFEKVINLSGIEDREGGLAAWIWICIGIAIGIALVILLGIWRYSYSTAGVNYRDDIQSILRKFKRTS